MSNDLESYKALLSEIIQKQMVILGPDIALLKARHVVSLLVDEKGYVTEVRGDPSEALQNLIDEYVSLSGLIVRKAMEPLLTKYPQIKLPEATPKSR